MSTPPAKKTKTLSVRFPRADARRITELSGKLGISKSQLIREALREKYVELRLSGAVEEKKQPPV